MELFDMFKKNKKKKVKEIVLQVKEDNTKPDVDNQTEDSKINMTKDEIIAELRNLAKPNEDFIISDNVLNAMNNYIDKFELVEPIIKIISENPLTDFGLPGELVHFVEKYYKQGYEKILIKYVNDMPTWHNIFMLHRCYNDMCYNDFENPLRKEIVKTIKNIKGSENTSDKIKNCIDEFDWD
jgi:hypothetical protein